MNTFPQTEPVDHVTVDAFVGMAAAGEWGGFFALQDDVGPDGTTWEDLVNAPAVLDRRTAEVAGLLGPDATPRVVSSLVHLGVVARLLSPAVGAVLAAGVLPVPQGIAIHLAGANPMPMAWSSVHAVPASTPREAADGLAHFWLGPLITPWTDRVAATGVSRLVLVGNVVSAVSGAVTIAVRARPDLAAPGADLLDALTTAGPLAASGGRRADGSFRRASCCLIYRLPGGGCCGDCVLIR